MLDVNKLNRTVSLLNRDAITRDEFAEWFLDRFLWENGLPAAAEALARLPQMHAEAIVCRLKSISASHFEYTPFTIGGFWDLSDVLKLRSLLQEFHRILKSRELKDKSGDLDEDVS